MEFFKFFLFGIAGLSMIFWVCVIALWHTYMFPRFFKEDSQNSSGFVGNASFDGVLKASGLVDRAKYSSQSFVIADFNPVEKGYGVNRLYTSMLLSLGVMSFVVITYGLHSGFKMYGMA